VTLRTDKQDNDTLTNGRQYSEMQAETHTHLSRGLDNI